MEELNRTGTSYLSFVVDNSSPNTSKDVRKIRLTVDRTDQVLKEESYREDNEGKRKNSTWYVLGSVGEIGFVIVIPIVLGIFAGSWLDGKFGTYPNMTLGGIVTGVILSVLSAYRTIEDIIRPKRQKNPN